MRVNQKPTGRAASMPAGLALGVLISLGITIMASVFFARMLDSEKIQWENIGYGILVLILIASFSGSITAYARIKRQRIVVCLLTGVLYFGGLLSMTAIFFGGQYEAVGVTAALILAGSGAAGLLGLKEKRGQRRKISIPHYC